MASASDPRAYHDRLLLGLSGIMSEAELHRIRLHLHQGERRGQRAVMRYLRPTICRCRYGRFDEIDRAATTM